MKNGQRKKKYIKLNQTLFTHISYDFEVRHWGNQCHLFNYKPGFINFLLRLWNISQYAFGIFFMNTLRYKRLRIPYHKLTWLRCYLWCWNIIRTYFLIKWNPRWLHYFSLIIQNHCSTNLTFLYNNCDSLELYKTFYRPGIVCFHGRFNCLFVLLPLHICCF